MIIDLSNIQYFSSIGNFAGFICCVLPLAFFALLFAFYIAKVLFVLVAWAIVAVFALLAFIVAGVATLFFALLAAIGEGFSSIVRRS
jgi:hypothetical protein